MFKFFILIIFNCSSIIVFSQNENKIWVLPNNQEIKFEKDSVFFNNSTILNNNESCSNICDENGDLLFYSNGITLYNKYNRIVKNGTNLGFPISNNETTSRNGTLLLKHPDNDSLLYLFSNDYQGRNGGLVYSKISIHGNIDSGEVIEKKINLISPINEGITAINHRNGRDIWICVHGYRNSIFYLFLLTKNGIVDCVNISDIGLSHTLNSYQSLMKFSNDGKYLFTDYGLIGRIELFKFDNELGIINKRIYFDNTIYSFGAEFINDSFLIVSANINNINKIFIYNLNTNLFNSKIISSERIYNLTLTPNNSIFGILDSSNEIISLISVKDTFKIKKFSYSNVNTRIFPTFNQSYFYTPAINYNYEMNCIKNSIQFWGKDTFGANSHVWQVRKLAVGNWQLVGSTKNINYTFSDTGTYEVRYIASNGNKADTVIKSIILYDKIKKDFLGKDTTYVQGDLINKTLYAPTPNHCVRWWFSKDLTPALSKGEGVSLVVDSVGTYICKVTNQAFCEVWDTIVISECINNLNQPSLFRSRDTLRTFHLNADSFVWFRNNQVYHISKEPFLALSDTGTYRVEAAKKGHCNRSSVGQLMVNRLSVNGINIEDIGIRVFPNPSEGNISIQSQNPFKLKINSVLGQTIYEAENIDNIHLPKGVYFLHFDVGGNRSVEKVVVW